MPGMFKQYDVVVIGAGPAGIFAALELAGATGDDSRSRDLRILMLEKGPRLEKRLCPLQTRVSGCIRCAPCYLLSGWGGAGAFSDGKLTLTPEIGGMLPEYVGREALDRLISFVDRVYLRYGAPQDLYGTDERMARELKRQAATADLILVPARIRHLGTERCVEVLRAMHETLVSRVEIRTGAKAAAFLAEGGRISGVRLASGEEVGARYVVCAPGREGAAWFGEEAQRLGLDLATNPVDIGVRVELPSVVMEHLTGALYEFKVIFHSPTFDDQVRTFCVCPGGEVVVENNDGLLTVNGHSYSERRTDLTNFALLVSKSFTEPFREPLAYGRHIATLANLLGGGVLVQRLGDLLAGRRSTPRRLAGGMVEPTLEDAAPGDLSLVLPYRHLISILEMMRALDRLAPGTYSRHTLLYGAEVKFYSSRLELTPSLETKVENLFAAGDGAGVTRGLMQASVSGVLAAREILRREGAE